MNSFSIHVFENKEDSEKWLRIIKSPENIEREIKGDFSDKIGVQIYEAAKALKLAGFFWPTSYTSAKNKTSREGKNKAFHDARLYVWWYKGKYAIMGTGSTGGEFEVVIEGELDDDMLLQFEKKETFGG